QAIAQPRRSCWRNEEANLGRCSVRPVKFKAAASMLISMCKLIFPRQEDGVMRMDEIDIHDYARQLLHAHGEMAVVEAAQKARNVEEKGETEEAETWNGNLVTRVRTRMA